MATASLPTAESVRNFFGKIRARQAERRSSAVKSFEELTERLFRIAEGEQLEEPDPAAVEMILADSGKSLADLEQAIDRRRELARTLALARQLPARIEARRKADEAIEAEKAEFARLADEHARTMGLLTLAADSALRAFVQADEAKARLADLLPLGQEERELVARRKSLAEGFKAGPPVRRQEQQWQESAAELTEKIDQLRAQRVAKALAETK